MRDFNITAEPSGKEKSQQTHRRQLPFVIQKHAASHLHYDFRLGWNGVLKSWAVAKGPSYVVADKRLAVQVEDHPMEYGGFEGIIPKGQYGGGTVMLWDQGTWEPQPAYPDVDAGLRDGSLKFILHGAKLKGKWALIRMKSSRQPLRQRQQAQLAPHQGTRPLRAHRPRSRHHRRGTQLRSHRPQHRTDRRQRRPRLELQRHRQPQSQSLASQDTSPQQQPHRRANSHAKSQQPATNRTCSRIQRPLPKEPLPTFIPPQLATQATDCTHRRRLAPRAQARRLPHPGPQRRRPRPAPHPHRPRLDAPHEDHRRRRSRRSPPRPPSSTAKSSSSPPTAPPASPTCRPPSRKAPKQPLTYFVFDLLHLNGHNLRNLPLARTQNHPRQPPRQRRPSTSASANTSTPTAKPSSARPARCTPKASSPSAPTPATSPAAPPVGSSSNASTSRSSSSAASPSPPKATPESTASARSSSATTTSHGKPHLRRPHRHRLHPEDPRHHPHPTR